MTKLSPFLLCFLFLFLTGCEEITEAVKKEIGSQEPVAKQKVDPESYFEGTLKFIKKEKHSVILTGELTYHFKGNKVHKIYKGDGLELFDETTGLLVDLDSKKVTIWRTKSKVDQFLDPQANIKINLDLDTYLDQIREQADGGLVYEPFFSSPPKPYNTFFLGLAEFENTSDQKFTIETTEDSLDYMGFNCAYSEIGMEGSAYWDDYCNVIHSREIKVHPKMLQATDPFASNFVDGFPLAFASGYFRDSLDAIITGNDQLDEVLEKVTETLEKISPKESSNTEIKFKSVNTDPPGDDLLSLPDVKFTEYETLESYLDECRPYSGGGGGGFDID